MKKITKMFYCNLVLLSLALLLNGCADDSNGASNTDTSKDALTHTDNKSEDTVENSQVDKKAHESNSATETEEPVSENTYINSSETKNANSSNANKNEGTNPLIKYSSMEIEYARIWLQLGPNQDIDELYIRQIPTGTPLNPDDETSANYPENVTQLSGSRLVDGSVTYSSNGDGTINQYTAVPLRWDGIYPAGKKEYTNILKKKKRVYVDVGNDEKIIKIINRMKN